VNRGVGASRAAVETISLEAIGAQAKKAAAVLAQSTGEQRRQGLHAMAAALSASGSEILKVNAADLENAKAGGLAGPLVDRLALNQKRLDQMAEGLRTVAHQSDPLGQVIDQWHRPNGLRIQKIRVPIGVIAVIYEARPNVTADVAGLCLMSGNAAVLRGSSHALQTNICVSEILRRALGEAELPPDCIQLVTDTSREAAVALMRLKRYIDLLIPRGGKALIDTIYENAVVPYIIDGDGNCHVYVDSSADLEMATAIVINAKTQRPGVCNAAETLLVHTDLAPKWLVSILDDLSSKGVEIRGDQVVQGAWPQATLATEADWGTEFLELILAVKVVASIDEAIAHVNKWGTSNAEAIIAEDEAAKRRFVSEVDSGSIFVNTSTRFSDGGEFGYGSEIGISTQRLHARGPMGLNELTTYKNVVWGDGQVRT